MREPGSIPGSEDLLEKGMATLFHGIWDLPHRGIKPMTPAVEAQGPKPQMAKEDPTSF